MTEKLFYQDSHLSEFKAKVISCESAPHGVLKGKKGEFYGVELDRTAFFPEGGGQYADTGIAVISFGCDRSNYDKCLKVIGKEVGRLQDSPLSQVKLKAAKKQFLGQLAVVSDNGEAQCLSMVKSLLAYGRVMTDEQTKEKVEAVEAGELQELSYGIFGQDRCSRLIFI